MSSTESIKIYTDGACRGNPGPGGWGAVLQYNDHEKQLSGAMQATTNNQMELLAAIEALNTLKRPCAVVLVTDSKYVKNGITQWIHQWKRNGWKTSARRSVKNAELWRQLDRLVQKHQVRWQWVQGHTGHPENERADTLARQAIDNLLRGE